MDFAPLKNRHFYQKETEKFSLKIGKKPKKAIALFQPFRYNRERNEQGMQHIYVRCVRFNVPRPMGYVRSFAERTA